MIRVKFDEEYNVIAIYQGPKRMLSLDNSEFGQLIRGVTQVLKEGSPAIARKQERKQERKDLMNQLKILVAIKVIDFIRWVKSFFTK